MATGTFTHRQYRSAVLWVSMRYLLLAASRPPYCYCYSAACCIPVWLKPYTNWTCLGSCLIFLTGAQFLAHENHKIAHKNAQKSFINFKPTIGNVAITGTNPPPPPQPKNICIYMTLCVSGRVRFERNCGKMCSRHLFRTADSVQNRWQRIVDQ